ncbi:winged helix-turn-helix transcriptional regulator [Winogradskyella sediminis]|uniref:DNA-binding transcriptional regulator, HxlR family n=1 Tax=Winogradskyella sediminis TaxID=1382466 RepID=A0A1H1XJI2_9FLAO|nr:helix-turn-helix domain-containing protein [Winogradskyella sediminis]REG86192.1 HxlR family transcriptional regulator [Winogradskyella sediminis]SDT09332.1 DNA-binding transcriptional regulator, HxlR family [Winogradskyella sediminis]
MYKFKGKEYPCCASLTMGVIGGKWKTVILFHLRDKTLRYNELRKEMPTVTERTLSLQLKTLEEDGIIKRKVYTSKPPLKVEYSLTDFGKTLIPVIQSIADWGVSVVEEHGDLVT